jgi:excisionase family DNA binding protein
MLTLWILLRYCQVCKPPRCPLRPASFTSRRPLRSANDSAQFLLPFLTEPMVPRAELQPNQPPSPQSLVPGPPHGIVAQPAGSTTTKAVRKALRPTKNRCSDRAMPAAVRSQPTQKQVMRSNTRPLAAGFDSVAVSPNIVALIEGRAEAWSARELAQLIGCTGKHIYALAKSGRLPHLRIGGMVRFDPAATAAWLRQRYIAA